MESIKNPRKFLSAAKEVSLTKPIILIKAGRTKESAKAAVSHTGSLSVSDEVLDAACDRVGILRVESISELFSMAEIFSKQPIPKGPNLSIITNAGGPGVVATDELVKRGGKLAKLDKKTIEQLNKILPASWSHNNPIDILGDADADLYEKTLKIISKDKNSDGILVILTPQYMTDPTDVAKKLKKFANIKKPIFASWMGEETVKKGRDVLADCNIPVFLFPDAACKAFTYMWKYSYNLKSIYETPAALDIGIDEKRYKKHKKVSKILKVAKDENRTILDEYESKKVLEAFEIPTTPTYIAKTKKEALNSAKKIGFPVVLKIYSKSITHKSDIGGVKLNLKNQKEVEKAFFDILKSAEKYKKNSFLGVTIQPMVSLKGFELIVGSYVDKEFGPVILFGAGGEFVEIFKDKSIALPPLNSNLAKKVIEKTKIFEALKGFRGRKKVNIEHLETILIRFSNLILEYPEIKECDINPLLASEDRMLALDARIVLHENREKLKESAVCPYPILYTKFIKINKKEVVIRPIRPEDESLVRSFLKNLSKNRITQNFSEKLKDNSYLSKTEISRICFTDYCKEITLVAQIDKKIIGIVRLTKIPCKNEATFALIWRGKKIGEILLKHLIEIAKKEKLIKIKAKMLDGNSPMEKLCRKIGFHTKLLKNNMIRAEMKL